MKKILLSTFLPVMFISFVHAQEPTLVKEIDTVKNESSNPKDLTVFNNKLYFNADARRYNGFGMVTNPEVWSSDGSENGTVMLADLNKTQNDNAGSYPLGFKAWKNKLYFVANGYPMPYQELYETDGTEAGTKKITSLELMVNVPRGLRTEVFTEFNNELYFVANDRTHGNELWKTDGTAAGTVMLKDINPKGGLVDYSSDIHQFTVMGGKLYFFANDQANDDSLQIWRTDGTVTEKLLTYYVNGDDEMLNSMTASATHLYYTYKGNLIKFDGTTATEIVTKGSGGTNAPQHLTAFRGEVAFTFFTDNPLVHHLAITSADPKGYTELKGGMNGIMATSSTYYMPLVTVDDMLYFTIPVSGNQEDFWKSDGTVAGTTLIRPFKFDTDGGIRGEHFVKHKGEVYFTVNRNNSYYFFKTDGTDAGTVAVSTQGIRNGVKEVTSVNDVLFFVSDNDPVQYSNSELWKLGTGTTGGGGTTGVRDWKNDENILLYPNPANREVHVVINGAKPLTVEVFDITGKNIAALKASASENEYTLDVSSLQQGQYFVRIQTHNSVSTRKLVISQ